MTETLNDKTETRQITGRRWATGRRGVEPSGPDLPSWAALENLTLGCRAFVLDPGGAASGSHIRGSGRAPDVDAADAILTFQSVFQLTSQ